MRIADLPIDRHVHTRWSLDIPQGPNFEDYCVHLETAQIRVGFLDHYELLYQEEALNPMGEDRFVDYLEQIDTVRSNWGDWVEFGLEVDYYPHPDRTIRLREFMDDHRGNFDFFVGTLHEVEDYGPVTIRSDLARMIGEWDGGFEAIVDRFFSYEIKMVQSDLFTAIAHPDTIFRFCNDLVPLLPEYEIDARLVPLARECARRDITVESNLSGCHYPIGRPFPSQAAVDQFTREFGLQFFVGSDSHDVRYFLAMVPTVKKQIDYLRSLGAYKGEF